MSYTPEQFSKLPQWAQKQIKTLENSIEHLIKQLEQFNGTSETNTYLREMLDRKPLPKDAHVEFECAGGRVAVYVRRDGTLNVNTQEQYGKSTLIMPRASNSFYVAFQNIPDL